jgi:hypothetical protein
LRASVRNAGADFTRKANAADPTDARNTKGRSFSLPAYNHFI